MSQKELLPFTRLPDEEMRRNAEVFREKMACRRSVRDFAPDPIPEGVIEACVESAGRAPSGANQQPWHFAVVRDESVKSRIREAAEKTGSERLIGSSLYVTLEPCAMCAGAISEARIARLYYGASDPKSGGVAHGARVFSHSQAHHVPEIYDGIGEAEAAELLVAFFKDRRD